MATGPLMSFWKVLGPALCRATRVPPPSVGRVPILVWAGYDRAVSVLLELVLTANTDKIQKSK